MSRFLLGVYCASLVLSAPAFATSFKILDGINFTAPNVNGSSNVGNPQIGDIIFDTSTQGFFGYSGADWLSLGTPISLVPPGAISAFAGSAAPSGYLICNGSTASRTTYAALFSAIGTAYGAGDGSTTFTLPDLRGKFLRGFDGTAGNDPDKASRAACSSGGNTGNSIGSCQGDVFGYHQHGQGVSSAYGNIYGQFSGPTNWGPNGYQGQFSTYPYTSAAGGSETRPKNVYVNFIIKY